MLMNEIWKKEENLESIFKKKTLRCFTMYTRTVKNHIPFQLF